MAADVVVKVAIQRTLPYDVLSAARAKASEAAPCTRNEAEQGCIDKVDGGLLTQ